MSEMYRKAGVDLEKESNAVGRIKRISETTHLPWVVSGVGGFSGLVGLKEIKEHIMDYEDPVLSFTIDGVGTKTMIRPRRFWNLGEDIVNHCVNDTIPSGATPIAFLDYIAQDELRPDEVNALVEGMARACKRAKVPIVGGETAQMNGVYREGEFDIVGVMAGMVERKDIIDGSAIRPGDILIGLASDGLHTNGYTLVRDIFSKKAWPGSEDYWPKFYYREIGTELHRALLRLHRSYLNPVSTLKQAGVKIRGIAHITGGGIAGNLVRILPKATRAKIEKNMWGVPPVFQLIQRVGDIPEKEMFEVFNMGIGMILVVSPGHYGLCMDQLAEIGCEAYKIGRVEKGKTRRVVIG